MSFDGFTSSFKSRVSYALCAGVALVTLHSTALAALITTPLGWGVVEGTKHKCDRMQIYNSESDTKWVVCANKIYEYKVINGKRQPPVERTIKR